MTAEVRLSSAMLEASSTLRRSRLIRPAGISCLLASMRLGWRSRRLDGREGLQDAIGMLGPRRHNPGVAGLLPLAVTITVLVKKLWVRQTLGEETSVPGEEAPSDDVMPEAK